MAIAITIARGDSSVHRRVGRALSGCGAGLDARSGGKRECGRNEGGGGGGGGRGGGGGGASAPGGGRAESTAPSRRVPRVAATAPRSGHLSVFWWVGDLARLVTTAPHRPRAQRRERRQRRPRPPPPEATSTARERPRAAAWEGLAGARVPKPCRSAAQRSAVPRCASLVASWGARGCRAGRQTGGGHHPAHLAARHRHCASSASTGWQQHRRRTRPLPLQRRQPRWAVRGGQAARRRRQRLPTRSRAPPRQSTFAHHRRALQAGSCARRRCQRRCHRSASCPRQGQRPSSAATPGALAWKPQRRCTPCMVGSSGTARALTRTRSVRIQAAAAAMVAMVVAAWLLGRCRIAPSRC